MSEFSGYEKMPNSLKKLGLNERDLSQLDKLKWVVTEKIHGANFSFVYENGSLKYAKRKQYLYWNDDFFGFQLVVNQLEGKIISLFEQLSTQFKASKYIIYGELFGGEYPHEEVQPVEGLHAIQTGVYYSPSIHFCAFDIAIETDELASKHYLDYETTITYFKEFELLHAQPLFVGKFGEALNFNTRINSTIPESLNLPALSQNLIEGVVVKPYNSWQQENSSTRPIIKIKNPEFDEEKKFHEAEKWTFIPDVSSKSQDLTFIVEELRNYVTENRLQSAISKIGSLDFENEKRVAEIANEFLKDTLTDFNENNDNLLQELTSEQNDWITERLKFEIKKLISEKS